MSLRFVDQIGPFSYHPKNSDGWTDNTPYIDLSTNNSEIESLEKSMKKISIRSCLYGDKCYRKNPEHIRKFHSEKKTCKYGDSCYRKNPEHIRKFHSDSLQKK